MFLTSLKPIMAAVLVIGLATVGTSTLLSRSQATQPPDTSAPAQADQDDLHGQVLQAQKQLQRLQEKLARLKEETQRRQDGHEPTVALLGQRFKYRVPFEIGNSEFQHGGHLEIREVWGTRPRVEVGGQYLVRGRYVLPPGQRGALYFFETTSEGGWVTTLDLQHTTVTKETGEFVLMHGMSEAGNFHIVLTDSERYSRQYANVYFGTGDNVLRKKSGSNTEKRPMPGR